MVCTGFKNYVSILMTFLHFFLISLLLTSISSTDLTHL